MLAWQGSLSLNDKEKLEDIHLSTSSQDALPLFSSITHLQFLAYVDPARIPLHIVVSPYLHFSGTATATRNWLSSIFENSDNNGVADDTPTTPPWYQTDQLQSSIAVLAKACHGTSNSIPAELPQITELLIYAVQSDSWTDSGGLLTPPATSPWPSARNSKLLYHALPLSSHLLYKPSHIPAPITSGVPDLVHAGQHGHASAEPSAATTETTETIEKRDRLTELFDTAADRRKRARRKGGQTVSLAATLLIPPQTSSAQSLPPSTRKTPQASDPTTETQLPDGPETKPHSPSNPLLPTNTTSEAHHPAVQTTTTTTFTDPSPSARNKQTISRTVMAGMRMHGLSQYKPTTTRVGSGDEQLTAMGAQGTRLDLGESDAEYKGVYHQAYKATVFAFRHDLGTSLLSPPAIRDVVDALLALFCK